MHKRLKFKNNKKGFTLIELLVALTLFIVIMTVSLSSIFSVFDANRRSKSMRTVMNNLNLTMDSMSREMRYGKNYHCNDQVTGSLTTPQNCPSGNTLMSFLSSENSQITYQWNDTSIEKRVGSGGFIPVTAPEVIIDDLTFYTLGAGTGNLLQPKVIIKVQGHVGTGIERSDFVLQTTVSQRPLDI